MLEAQDFESSTARRPGRGGPRFVVSAIHGGPARDVSRLLVSEAATNAVLHSASGDGGTFSVGYLISDHLLRVEVRDGGARAAAAASTTSSP